MTGAQRRALQHCAEAGRLWQDSVNLWNWYRTHENGMVIRAAANPTIYTLAHNHGFLKFIEFGKAVELTAAGRAALKNGNRTT